MNSLLLLIVVIPATELIVLIKVGQSFGAINTVLLIFLTAAAGLYIAKFQSLQNIRSGLTRVYQNKTPTYEIISGASIAVAAILLIIPGFITDFFGFVLLIPLTRKILINFFIRRTKIKEGNTRNDVLDGEIVDDNKDKKKNDEL